MAPSTAVLFVIFGGAVPLREDLSQSPPFSGLSVLMGWAGTLLSSLLLVLSVRGIHLPAEHLGIRISGAVNGAPIGHMSPMTASCFLIIGCSFLICSPANRKRALASFWLATVVFLTSMLLLVGYLVNAPLFYGTGIIPPALTTSVAFLALGIAQVLSAGRWAWPQRGPDDGSGARMTVLLVLVFCMLTTGILGAGYFYSKRQQKHFHASVESELSAIADLKVNELVQWRKECFRDASLFFKNSVFSGQFQRLLENPDDAAAREWLLVWLEKVQEGSQYSLISLRDVKGVEWLSIPGTPHQTTGMLSRDAAGALNSRQIAFEDFHRNGTEATPHLDILIPILAGPDWEKVLGLLTLQVDPERYLYPLIKGRTPPASTAETLLVRREGSDVVFLHDLKFLENAALNLRFPLTQSDLPAVMAVQGRKGIVSGNDYRGVPVVAALRSVPDSPWFLVERVDRDEINRPLRERLFWITGLLGALLVGAGAAVGFVWRNQRAGFYRLRYQAAMKVKESEKRLRVLFESTRDGILVADVEKQTFVLANVAMCRMLGYSNEELLTKGVQDIHPPAELSAVIAQFDRQVRGETSLAAKIPMLRKDGSLFYADINAIPLELDGLPCILGTFRDITDRMQAEARIEHLNRVLRAIRTINHLMVRAESVDELIQKACSLLVDHQSYTSAMIILAGEDGEPVTHVEAGVGAEFQLLIERIEQGDLPHCCESARKVDGVCLIGGVDEVCKPCPIASICISPQKMAIRLEHQHTIYGYLAVSVDSGIVMDSEEEALFTELAGDLAYSLHNMEVKRTMQRGEEEKKKLEAQLFQSQKMEAVGQLAGGVAHDFNNLLSIIIGYSQMIQEDMAEGFPVKDEIGEIYEAAIRAKNLTRQLLAFSRKQMLEMRIVDVNRVITDFEKLLRRTIGEDIHMITDLTSEPALVKADISQLEQILMNLAVNARDAMPEGGVVTLETTRVTLDEAYAASRPGVVAGPHVMIVVSDTGQGMDRETLDRIFEPFFTTKGIGRGTGLGLSTVYGVVKQHGGNIWVYSEPGRGTTFKIYLPAADGAAPVEKEQKKAREQQPTAGLTVLVVEDEPSLRKLACRILEQGGYLVVETRDAEDAVAISGRRQEPIHLLLTDVIMPKMKGPEVFTRVRAFHPETKVLYMSGYTENVIARQGVLKEGVHFLQKPFSSESLLHHVFETLAEKGTGAFRQETN